MDFCLDFLWVGWIWLDAKNAGRVGLPMAALPALA
jgi:hypothetical protein